MSNRQERRNNRMNNRLLKLFGQGYTISWQGRRATLYPGINSWSEERSGPEVHVAFIGNNYVVKVPALQFHWQGSHLPTAAKQLKLLTMLGG